MKRLVSVLIPAYNAERWIGATIASATNQTWPNKEVIVVDDGSGDSTYEAAKQLESGNVKVVTQPNGGACEARNKALSLAQGDFIQWLDADDLLHPQKIARQLARASDATHSRTLLTCSWGTFYFRTEKAKFAPDALWKDMGPIEWITTKFSENVWMNPAVWLVSRGLTDAAGPWDTRLATSGDDDGEYLCRVVAASDQVKFVSDARCYYRIGSVGSLNWNMERSEKSLKALILSLSLSIEHLLRLEDSDRTRTASLKYLEAFLPSFYGCDQQLIERVLEMGRVLGGALSPPRASWKYLPIEKAFGPVAAKRVMNNWRAAKQLAAGKWDRFMFDLTRTQRPEIRP